MTDEELCVELKQEKKANSEMEIITLKGKKMKF
jgi:hypothetical protein